MRYRRNGVVVESLPDDFYSTRNYTDELLEWLDEDAGDDSPFFAYLSYTAPHDPLHAPQEYIDKYKGTYDEGWDVLRERRLEGLKVLGIVPSSATAFPRLPTVEAWTDLPEEERQERARDMEVYAAMIDYIDGQLARVFDHLRESGEYDNTLIVFMSDNGANGLAVSAYPGQTSEYVESFDNSLENRGRPGSAIDMGSGWAQASMSPSRMYKAFASEGGVRVPLLVKLPGQAANAGTMNHSFFHVRDIMPTLLDAAGVVPGEEFDGRAVLPLQGQSVLDLFAGETETAYAGADQVGTELFGMMSYVSGNWKILRMPVPVGTGEWELHDLSEDPAELNDLSATYPDRLNEMIALWEQYKTDNGVLEISAEIPE
jgi:arylsulfatase